jgi:hypothetical protein
MTIDDVWKKIQAEGGPSHIVLDAAGTTELREIALKKDPELQWDVIYIRDDGYSYGCDFYLAQHVEALFRDQWIGVVNRGALRPRVMNFRLDKDPQAVV